MPDTITPVVWPVLQEVPTVTLKQRVLEAAESARQQKLKTDVAAMRFLLTGIGAFPCGSPDEGRPRIDKRGEVRLDYEGLSFRLREQTHYEEDDYTVKETQNLLDAQRICPIEGCDRLLFRPLAMNVQSLADLAPLFEERADFVDCGRHREGYTPSPDEDDDLEDLPF